LLLFEAMKGAARVSGAFSFGRWIFQFYWADAMASAWVKVWI
jgi:hypothetical protein